MAKLQEFYSIIILMKFKTQKSVTDKITSNNLNSMGFNSFLLRSTFGLLFIHGYIIATFVEFFVHLQSLSAKIASMSISELLPSRPASAMIPDDNNAREIIRYFIDVQKRAKLLGVISSHEQIPKPIFSYVHIATGKGGYFFSRTENTVIICHLVSIDKYNNTIDNNFS